jgi:two-component system sensor histidine kinase DesK
MVAGMDTPLLEKPRPGLWARTKAVLAPSHPYVWLVYLPLYFIPWFQVQPDLKDIIGSAIGIGVFLVLYVRGHRLVPDDLRSVPYIVAIAIVACVMQVTVLGNPGVLAVYAYALAGAILPVRSATLIVGAMSVALGIFVVLVGGYAWYMGFGIFLGLMVALGNAFSRQIEEKNRQLVAAQGDIRQHAAAAERERIARDLHDLLGHTLTVVAVKADLAARLVDIDPVRAKVEMQDLQATARTALADIRSAVTGMRRIALGAELAQARNALAAVDTTLSVTGPDATLPALVEETLAMLLREGATNVVRHARASKCEVVIDVEPHEVRFILSDDGVGGDIREGNGLSGMRARVAAAGGKLDIKGGQGTRIEAVLPLGAAA